MFAAAQQLSQNINPGELLFVCFFCEGLGVRVLGFFCGRVVGFVWVLVCEGFVVVFLCYCACCHGSRMLTRVLKQCPARKTPSTEVSLTLGLWVLLWPQKCLVEIQLKAPQAPTLYLSVTHLNLV